MSVDMVLVIAFGPGSSHGKVGAYAMCFIHLL